MARGRGFDPQKRARYRKSVIFLVALLGVGQTTEVPRLIYAAPKTCPDEQSFARAVQRRVPDIPLDAPAPQSLQIEVRTSSTGTFAGELVVREGAHTFKPRRVSGAVCDEVVSALALIASIVLRSPPEAPSPPPNASPPFQDVQPVLRSRAANVTRGEPSRWAVATGLAADAGTLPAIAVSVPIEVAYGAVDRGIAGPVVRAGLRWGRRTTDDDLARFTLVAAALDACPWTFAEGPWKLEPCAHLVVGWLGASGQGLAQATEAARGFAAVGVRGRGAWFLTPWVFIELSAKLELPLVRDRFAARPDQTLHRASAVAGGLQSGVGVIFW